MAKKRISRHRVTKVEKWNHDDVAELIAWLDHCLEHNVIDFRASISSHLRRSREKEYDISQIETKLKGIRERKSSAPYQKNQTWRDVFTFGSKVLWLRDDERGSLAKAQARLEDHALAALLTPDRRLRSTSRLSGSPLPLKIRFSPVQRKHRSNSQQESRENYGSRSTGCAKRESEPADLAAQKDLPPMKKQRRASQIVWKSFPRNCFAES